MANYDKVKILVVGDSGVGKTSAVHLMCFGRPLAKPSWTVGAALEVKLHEFKGGTPAQKTYFLEFWDVGGSSAHRNSRPVFYNGVNGIILVHDLSNRKSEVNLQKWLMEIYARSTSANNITMTSPNSNPSDNTNSSGLGSFWGSSTENLSFDEFDPELFTGSSYPPILVIGTKLDHYAGGGDEDTLPTRTKTPKPSTIAQECGAEEMFMNCLDAKSISPGSTAAVKLTRFFDKVIERRYHRESSSHGLYDRRKLYPSSSSSRLF